MKVLVGTQNPGKLEGAKRAFERYFDNVEIVGVPVDSGVSKEPLNEEIRKGVETRVQNVKKYAKENGIDADYYIASEAGFFNTFGMWMDTNFAMIEDKNGFKSYGSSDCFVMPDRLAEEAIRTELRDVMNRIFNMKDMNKAGGGINNLTDEAITRIDLTEHAYIMALIEHRKRDIWN